VSFANWGRRRESELTERIRKDCRRTDAGRRWMNCGFIAEIFSETVLIIKNRKMERTGRGVKKLHAKSKWKTGEMDTKSKASPVLPRKPSA